MKNIKGLIIAIVIFSIYGLVMYFVLGKPEQGTTTNNTPTKTATYYMVVGESGIYKYEKNSFSKASKNTIEALNNMKVFVDNKYFGNYRLKYVAKWNLLNDKYEFVSYKGRLLAVSNDFEVVPREYTVREINDDDKYLLLQNYGISSFKYLTTNEVVDIDLDKNGVEDEIIVLSSMEDNDNINNYYNLVLIKYNNEVITLIDERKEDALYVYNINSIINILDNSNDSIILNKIEGYLAESSNVTNVIINYKNSNYVID
ncbi:MAG: hypothetical protein E7159_03590 [Firmicutes bacterium]|nr:hypothetical protein [Bacillota bacterium]